MSYLAQVTYTGNGSTTGYAIPFSYIASSHIKTFIDNVASTAFTISGSTLTFTSAPANSAVIRIERQTPTDARLVDFTDGSVLTEAQLDQSADQNFFIAQETSDANQSSMTLDTDDKFDAQSKVIKNVANPTANNDAVNKTYLENTWLSTANKTALTNVNSNIANINSAVSNESNINSAVSNSTNINLVAGSIGSVNTVATDITKVIAVANDLAEAVSEVETVADDLNEATSEIEVVANAIANVDIVGNAITNVNTLAGKNTELGLLGTTAVVTDLGLLGTSANVTAMGLLGTSANVTAMGLLGTSAVVTDLDILGTTAVVTDLDILATSDNVTKMGNLGTSANVTAMGLLGTSSVVSNMGTLGTSTNVSNMSTLAGISNLTNLADAHASVTTVATNIASVNSFANTYLGASSSAPTLDPDGSALDIGDLYFDTTASSMKVYSSGGWINSGSSVNGTANRFSYTATAGQTTFTGADANGNTLAYDAGYVDIFLNGIKIVVGTDVTATSGSSVVLTTGASLNDTLELIAYGTFTLANFSITDANDVPALGTAGQALVVNSGATALEFSNASSAEVYGFHKDSNGDLIVTTTNQGVDNISSATYATFDDVLFSASGFTFSLNNGELIATI